MNRLLLIIALGQFLFISLLYDLFNRCRGCSFSHFYLVLYHLTSSFLLLFDHTYHGCLLRQHLVLDGTLNILLTSQGLKLFVGRHLEQGESCLLEGTLCVLTMDLVLSLGPVFSMETHFEIFKLFFAKDLVTLYSIVPKHLIHNNWAIIPGQCAVGHTGLG